MLGIDTKPLDGFDIRVMTYGAWTTIKIAHHVPITQETMKKSAEQFVTLVAEVEQSKVALFVDLSRLKEIPHDFVGIAQVSLKITQHRKMAGNPIVVVFAGRGFVRDMIKIVGKTAARWGLSVFPTVEQAEAYLTTLPQA